MGIDENQKIKNEFSELKLHPTYCEHEPVATSQDAAKARGDELKQGIKALVFTDGKENWVIVNLPADKKVDLKKVAAQLSWSRKEIRMAAEEEVFKKTGCEIGAVPPFGHKTSIPLLIDKQIYENKESAFNIGLRTNSVKIPTHEMKIVFNKFKAIEGDFVK